MNWLSLSAATFAFSRYLSVVLALFVAFALSLPNPWWAMLTVFLVQPTQPLVGAIWAKAWYRVGGTMIGCVASIVLIPHLADSAVILILSVAGWISLCLVGALLDRTPRSYMYMLAGYTVALVGLPTATTPAGIFDIAVGRTEEIIIGVLASAVVQSLLFPRSVAGAMQHKLDAILQEARAWISEGLRSQTPAPTPRHLASALTEVNLLATDWRFEGGFPSPRRWALRALEERLVAIVPLMASIEDLLKVMPEDDVAADRVAPLLDRIARWVGSDAPGDDPAELIVVELQAAAPELGASASWSDILTSTLVERLSELVRNWEACVRLAEQVRQPVQAPWVRKTWPRAKARSLHVDFGVALRPALTVAATIICGGAFTVLTHWESGPLAVGLASVICALFASANDPIAIARAFVVGFIISFPVALLYAFTILPMIDGFVMLAAALFPFLFICGLLLTQPRFALVTMPVVAGFSVGLSLQPTFNPNPIAFMNIYVAAVAGALLALVGLSLGRSLPAHKIIQRILRASWRDLARLTATARPPARAVWSSRMLDRAGLLLPRLAIATPRDEWDAVDALRDLRLGAAIIELRQLSDLSGAGLRREIEDLLAGLGEHYRALSVGEDASLPPILITRLDGAIGGLLRLGGAADRQAGVAAAADLRQTLFPRAPAYAPAMAQA